MPRERSDETPTGRPRSVRAPAALLFGWALLGCGASGSEEPATASGERPETPAEGRAPEHEAPAAASDESGAAAPSEEAFRALFADHLVLRRVDGPRFLLNYWTQHGYPFCATARAPGTVDVGLRHPSNPAERGRVRVRIQRRAEPRTVSTEGVEAHVAVGDEVCLVAPLSETPWEWFRPEETEPGEAASPRTVLGPLRAEDGPAHERAAVLAPQLVRPQRVRVGNEDGFSEVRFTAARTGTRFHSGTSSITIVDSREAPVRAWLRLDDGGAVMGAVELRPDDAVLLSRARLSADDDPIPATEFL